eukprot:scaffold186212_cov20-Prasinocladus_malaysianus.AAC.1
MVQAGSARGPQGFGGDCMTAQMLRPSGHFHTFRAAAGELGQGGHPMIIKKGLVLKNIAK